LSARIVLRSPTLEVERSAKVRIQFAWNTSLIFGPIPSIFVRSSTVDVAAFLAGVFLGAGVAFLATAFLAGAFFATVFLGAGFCVGVPFGSTSTTVLRYLLPSYLFTFLFVKETIPSIAAWIVKSVPLYTPLHV
jgi:hypothetical protein